MKRKPTQDEWQSLADLTAAGVVRDDESIFALQSIMAYRPEFGKSLEDWFRQRIYRYRRRKPDLVISMSDCGPSAYYSDGGCGDGLTWKERADERDNEESRDAAIDIELIRDRIGPAGYAVLNARYGDGLSVSATAKRLGLTKESVRFIESEALARASSGGAGHE